MDVSNLWISTTFHRLKPSVGSILKESQQKQALVEQNWEVSHWKISGNPF